MKRALVTGGTGFVGSHIVRRLVRDGCEVHLLCREQSDFHRIADVLPELRRHFAPLEDDERLKEAVRQARPEFVYHLAAATVVAGAAAGAADLIGVNLLGTVRLLEALEAVDYAGFAGTGDSFEYTPARAPLAETDACRPDTLHGISKLAATLYGQAEASAKGRPIVTLRLFSVYGPGDHPRRLVPRVIQGALAGTPLLLSRWDIARDWVYVGDVVELYLEAARNASRLAGGVFNAGSGIATGLEAIVGLILRLTQSAAQPRWGVFPVQRHDDFPWVADTRATFSAFSWRPKTSLEDGMRATIAALRSGG